MVLCPLCAQLSIQNADHQPALGSLYEVLHMVSLSLMGPRNCFDLQPSLAKSVLPHSTAQQLILL